MGTRNLTMVIHEGKPVVAQYGQWDGYPEGLGNTARKFMRERFLRPLFLARLNDVRWITEEEIKAGYKAAGHDGGDFVNMEVSHRFHAAHPYLTRDHGAKILELIQDSTGPVLIRDSSGFAGDSLFCEWAYVIDLDKNTFEVYKGFNHEPVPEGERFAAVKAREKSSDGTPYYPVKHVISFPLNDLPRKDEFLKAINRALPEEEEAA